MTGEPAVRAFVQARMTSRRFPGKVLAPFRGRPLIAHVLERVAEVMPREHVVLATSGEPSDDPLAGYVAGLGYAVYRGSLDDVVARFQGCLREHPCRAFLRVCGDSPLLDTRALRGVLDAAGGGSADLVTNVYPRTWPKGHSAELVRSSTFASLVPGALSAEQCEHLTKVFYDAPERYHIVNVTCPDAGAGARSYVVDTLADLERLEAGPA